ncbi:MAG: hypothetical protein CMJ77_21635 [Planctomycetaceae bacterium]|nr:hypothetical protein [Planctomycetaceae bacterium]
MRVEDRRSDRPLSVQSGVLLLYLLTGWIASWPVGAFAQSQWPDQRRDGEVLYHANFRLDAHAPLLDELSSLRQEVPRRLGLRPTRGPVQVYLFSNQNVYEAYLRQYFPGVPYRRALFIKERGPGMVFAYRSSEFAIDLRHEFTHAVLHANLPMVPLWLDEGLAEYFEVPISKRQAQNPHLRSVRWRLRLRQIPDLERLEQFSELSEMKRDDYRDAWAWVHFMLNGPQEAQAELKSYLADVQSHIPPGSLRLRLQRRLPNLTSDFVQHFESLGD